MLQRALHSLGRVSWENTRGAKKAQKPRDGRQGRQKTPIRKNPPNGVAVDYKRGSRTERVAAESTACSADGDFNV